MDFGQRGVRDVFGVRGVVDDDRALPPREGDELLELGARRAGPGRVVGRAEIDEVGVAGGRRAQVGEEAVRRCAGEVAYSGVARPVGRHGPGRARDHAAVHVDRIGGVLHGYPGAWAEHRLEPADVALGPVGHEDLARLDSAAVEPARRSWRGARPCPARRRSPNSRRASPSLSAPEPQALGDAAGSRARSYCRRRG